MQVEVSTGNQIDTDREFLDQVDATVTEALERFGEQIIRVLVHFGDENSTEKGGDNDKRCTLEARIGGLDPIAVVGHGSTLDQALDSAVDKLVKTLDRTFERLHDPKGRTPYGGEPVP